MSQDLGKVSYAVLGLDLTPVEVEAAAGDIKAYPMPMHGEVVAFGVYITEDFAAHAVDPKVELTNRSKIGGIDTSLKILTLGSSNAALKRSDGTKAAQTSIVEETDLDNGQVVLVKLEGVARKFRAGDVLVFEKNTAAGEIGGAYVPFVVITLGGLDLVDESVWIET